MLNAMSLTVLRQFFMGTLTRCFPVKRMPDSVTDALKAAAEGKITLNPAVPRYGRFRGRLNYDRAKCIGCAMCTKVCPAHAIELDPETAGKKPRKVLLHGDRCCFCAQCNDVCPVSALSMTTDFAFASMGDRKASTTRQDTGKATRLPFQKEWLDPKPGEIEEFLPPVQEEEKPAAPAAAPKPAVKPAPAATKPAAPAAKAAPAAPAAAKPAAPAAAKPVAPAAAKPAAPAAAAKPAAPAAAPKAEAPAAEKTAAAKPEAPATEAKK